MLKPAAPSSTFVSNIMAKVSEKCPPPPPPPLAEEEEEVEGEQQQQQEEEEEGSQQQQHEEEEEEEEEKIKVEEGLVVASGLQNICEEVKTKKKRKQLLPCKLEDVIHELKKPKVVKPKKKVPTKEELKRKFYQNTCMSHYDYMLIELGDGVQSPPLQLLH